MQTLFVRSAVALTTATLCLAAQAETFQPVRITFVPTVGDTPVGCTSVLKGLGITSVDAKLQDLRFYVSNVKLTTTEGVEVAVTLDANDAQLTSGSDTVALIDLENAKGLCAGDASRHAVITGKVPKGTYNKLAFTLGVPESLNHTDTATAPAPLDNTDMGWSWQVGRKHIKIEVNPKNATTGEFTQGIQKYDSTTGKPTGTYNDSFYFHLGNTGCEVDTSSANGYTCSSDNTLPLHFHGFDYQTQRVAVDLKALFAKTNLTREWGGPPGCMSGATDPECKKMWSVIGSRFVAQTADDGTVTYISKHNLHNAFFHGETVFRAISK